MSEITIKKVETKQDQKRFITFPWKIYKDDPLWVPPLLPGRLDMMDPQQGVFIQRGEVDFFMAYKNDQLVGTICTAEDPPTNQNRGTKECVFGLLEFIEDFDVFQALIETAREWGRKRGLNQLYGPWNLDYEDSYGVLVEGRDAPPVGIVVITFYTVTTVKTKRFTGHRIEPVVHGIFAGRCQQATYGNGRLQHDPGIG